MELFEKIESVCKSVKQELESKEVLERKANELHRENKERGVRLVDISKYCNQLGSLSEHLQDKNYDNLENIENIRVLAHRIKELVFQRLKSRDTLGIELSVEIENMMTAIQPKEEVWKIYDIQKREFRDEEYSSREEAIKEFSEYWKEIVFSDVLDTFDFEDYKSKNDIKHELKNEEETKIVEEYLDNWANIEFLEWYEFDVINTSSLQNSQDLF